MYAVHVGLPASCLRMVTFDVRASIRAIPVAPRATQKPPPEGAIPVGLPPVSMTVRRLVRASMRDTVPSAQSVTHAAPAAKATSYGDWPTSIVRRTVPVLASTRVTVEAP